MYLQYSIHDWLEEKMQMKNNYYYYLIQDLLYYYKQCSLKVHTKILSLR